MAEETTRPRLGRGLAALIGEVGDEMNVGDRGRGGQRKVPIEFLRPNPRNPRKIFNEAELGELALSIRQRGLIQPIIVRPMPNLPDAFEIVAGERRWRAAQRAELHEVPVVVVDIDDRTSAEYAVIENIQRTDLTPLEEAEGYNQLLGEFKYRHEDLSHLIGKSRVHVTNMLRLLNLPEDIKDLLRTKQITAGHARALLMVENPSAVARQAVARRLTVREIEAIAQDERDREDEWGYVQPKTRTRREKDPDTRALENALQDVLGLAVSIEHKGKGGDVRIRYKTLEQLDGLCRRLKDTARPI
jgi:ParB family transcriptional regulator, chromosome partitioning protein